MNNFGGPRVSGYMQSQGGGGGGVANNSYSTGQKPKVGLAVVCRCAAGNSFVQCLLQKRGLHTSSPNKWSFPGGRLEKSGDLEDDGAVGTKRELTAECGGGIPLGLPPLIHIECCKTGKSQTLYHVYVVDTSREKEWESWQPKSKNGKSSTELDTVVSSLSIQGQTFTCTNGYCWVDMSALIQECYMQAPPEFGGSDLQHGLVRWVQNYGEHILKILIARSPKLPHPRRLSNPLVTSPSSQNGYPALGNPRPRPIRQDMGGKPQRFNVRGGMLQPPYPHGQFIQPNFPIGNNQTSAFYSIGMIPNQGQLSPPTGGVAGSTTVTTPTNSTGGIHGYPGSVVMHVPSGQAQGGLVYVQPPLATMIQTSVESPNHPMSTQPSSPVLSSQDQVGVANSEGGETGLYLVPQTQSLMSTTSPLMATSTVPVGVSNSQHQLIPGQPPGGAQLPPGPPEGGGPPFEQQPRAIVHPNMLSGSVFPMDTAAPSISVNHYLSQLTTNTTLPSHHLPPPPPHPPPPVSNTSHTSLVDSEPLLPNPPHPPTVPLLPLAHPLQAMPPQPGNSVGGNGSAPFPSPQPQQPPPPPQQQHGGPPQQHGGPPQQHGGSPQSSRKEILCRHYIQGNCPFGEKCWFAHPEPSLVGVGGGGGGVLPPRGTDVPSGGQAIGISPSPLHVQVPPNFWMNNPLLDYAMASPPQSPMNHTLMPRPPIIPALFRPRGGMPYPGQQPFVFLRGPLAGTARLPGSNLPLLQTTPIPMPVNPVLKFALLSQVVLNSYDGDSVVTDVSQLATYADHFFVSYEVYINTYKIVFGGNKNYQESAVTTEKMVFGRKVSCLECSQQQPTLLLVGTEEGCVSILDMRKGVGHGNITNVHFVENVADVDPVCALIHFSTSINSAQVVVTGSERGAVSWHISQPPQKTYSPLFLDIESHGKNKILALQMLGGFLVSGDTSGQVIVWSMMSQTPSIHNKFQSHSASLTNLHMVNANHFITIGTESSPNSDDATNSSKVEHLVPESFVAPSSSTDLLSLELSQLSMSQPNEEGSSLTSSVSSSDGSEQFSVKLWEYGRPLKLLKSIDGIDGTVMSSSFHCHNPPGNLFLGLGMKNGVIKIYNIPDFTISSELHFPEMNGKDCRHIRLNLSRETPLITHAYYRNPFRDLILTSVWSDGKIMVCQVAKQ